MVAIQTYNLTKQFGTLTAVNSLNLAIHKGTIFGLLGPNGAGKSTLLSMLCTILNPTSGTATVNGYDILTESEKVRQSIGIVFQSISIDDRLTGRENLKFHAMLYNVPEDKIAGRIDEVLALLELSDRADDLVRTYSGGMIRRLEMARGLLHHPHILFLDEPTIGLDPQTREHIWSYIQELTRKKKGDLTVLLTTHYMDEADLLCDEVAIIDKGQIIVRDTPGNLKQDLQGEKISFNMKSPEILASLLSDNPRICKVSTESGLLEVQVIHNGNIVQEIFDIAREAGIEIDHISIHESSMHDVFLHYTGKEIRKEEDDNFTSQYRKSRRRR
ncbi:ATP-binding cassette domain-containing protein [Methanospirillum stamsii]|uniref:ABC transporter ATP-binding protein n=1 Tax=Methanospirillum stamsii TaxID=1277351 RepID=A0A2V2N0I8_9EURY|nr:ATP-binding cassette domain-containing protein [Methanospirillum stamsii]PWR69687.1 ABC transporter ATP-binding protein [Methanospirillum stamsii]